MYKNKKRKNSTLLFFKFKKNEIKINENNIIIGVKLEDLYEFLNKEEIKLNNKEIEELKNNFKMKKLKNRI